MAQDTAREATSMIGGSAQLSGEWVQLSILRAWPDQPHGTVRIWNLPVILGQLDYWAQGQRAAAPGFLSCRARLAPRQLARCLAETLRHAYPPFFSLPLPRGFGREGIHYWNARGSAACCPTRMITRRFFGHLANTL